MGMTCRRRPDRGHSPIFPRRRALDRRSSRGTAVTPDRGRGGLHQRHGRLGPAPALRGDREIPLGPRTLLVRRPRIH